MKILGIVSFFNVAGAPAAIVRLLNKLADRGHSAQLVGLYEKGALPLGQLQSTLVTKAKRPTPLDYAAMPLKLTAILRQQRPDAVIAFLPLAAVLGLSLAALLGIPRRVASQRVPGDTFGGIMRLLDRWAGTIGVYTDIICVSTAVADSFKTYPERYKAKLSVVHNGMDWHPSRLDHSAARASFNVAADLTLVVAVGRLSEQKNYNVLLDALQGVDGIRCLVAGDGELRATLEAHVLKLGIADRIVFLGKLPPDRIADLLAAADLFVQPSRFEGQSNALLEAMNQGLASIVSDIPEQRETVLDPDLSIRCAMLCDPDDSEDWRHALRTLKNDTALRAELAANGKMLVHRHFTLAKMIDGFEDVLVAPPKA